MFNSKAKKAGIYFDTRAGRGRVLSAKRLVHEGYAVTAIEPDPRLVGLADGSIDARLINGNA